MDRDERIHARGLEHLCDIIIGTQDDQVATVVLDDLGADEENANAVGGEEVHGGKIDHDLLFFRDDLVEWQLDDHRSRRIEAPTQGDLGDAAAEIVDRDVHTAARWSAIHSRAVLAVFPWRRNAQTVPVQKISDRFSGKKRTVPGAAQCRAKGNGAPQTGPFRSVAVPDQRCTATLCFALHRIRDRTYLVAMRVRGDQGAWPTAATMPGLGSI